MGTSLKEKQAPPEEKQAPLKKKQVPLNRFSLRKTGSLKSKTMKFCFLVNRTAYIKVISAIPFFVVYTGEAIKQIATNKHQNNS